jgi:hypothetical protein
MYALTNHEKQSLDKNRQGTFHDCVGRSMLQLEPMHPMGSLSLGKLTFAIDLKAPFVFLITAGPFRSVLLQNHSWVHMWYEVSTVDNYRID